MPWKKFVAKLKHHFEEVIRTKAGIRSIALGFSIGTFITILPTPGLNILVGLLIILIFPKVSKYALFTSYFVFNGIVKTPIYIFAIWLGGKILGDGQEIVWRGLLDTTALLTKNFLVGIIILDVIITITSYHVVYHLVRRYKKRHGHL